MRPFGCHVTILNTIDHLGKFDGKTDEGFFVGYSLNSKAFRVFNSRTRIVEENLHIRFSKSTPTVAGSRLDWLFDIDALTRTMNYETIVAGTQSNGFIADPPFSQDPKSSHDDGSKPSSDDGKKVDKDPRKDSVSNEQEKEDNVNSTNNVNVASINEANAVGGKISIELPIDPNMHALEDYNIFDSTSDDQNDGAEADMNNLDKTIQVSPISTTRIHKYHSLDQVIVDLQSATETRNLSKNFKEHGRTQKGNSCIKGSKLDRGYAGRASTNQATRKYIQEEEIDYDEVFAPVARIETIRLFLVYASFKDFMVYQMDVKSVFLNGKIEEEVYVCQALGFEDPDFVDRVYKVEKALHKGDILLVQVYVDDIIFGLTKKELVAKEGWHIISQDKYVGEILKKFGFTEDKTTSTPMETQKPLLKDEDGEEVNVHMYRSMIDSLMYLTSLRPDIMFAVCVCARYQVNPKVSHLYAVKRIFRYLKGQPKLVLWYPKDSPFDLVAYTDSDYARASLDRKSTTRDCQFLRSRLISWQCKKQTVVANSTTKAEYVVASSFCGQVLWILNQLLDYGDCNEKKLIQMVKIHTDKNVADLLTKAFEVTKTVNGEVQLQALVDGKKIIITESTVRRDLQLEDAEGVDCLPNSTIFEQLTLMGYEKISQKLTFYKAFFSPQWKFLIHTILQCLSSKTTAWNEFSSTMASAIICLATNQKFNFSKYIFESMVKNLDNVGKFLMYPRFIQVFLDKQLEGMPTHNRIYIAPSHTKKIFGNMRRVGK
ncbi:retrovirus-related pol polyprotein from transposon TNT 1-94, partial [Tanacetum coccineum]